MCIIVYKKINKKTYILKNRDRNYKPSIKIIHEIRNGVEVVYIEDAASLWVEGMNQYGYGILNTTMNEVFDSAVGFTPPDNVNMISKEKYLNALCQKNAFETLDKLLTDDFCNDMAFQGHTVFAGFNNLAVHIESKTKQKSKAEIICDEYFSTTNHGLIMPKFGGVSGYSLLSSTMRKTLIDLEMANLKIGTINDIKQAMNQNYSTLENNFNTYKLNKNNGKIFTTGQIGICLTDKIFTYSYDILNCNFIGIDTKLPQNYKPIIKIIVESTTKNTNDSKQSDNLEQIQTSVRTQLKEFI